MSKLLVMPENITLKSIQMLEIKSHMNSGQNMSTNYIKH